MNKIDKMEYDLAGQIIGLAMNVHSALGPGFLESVYQKALVFEIKEAGLNFEEEKEIPVLYRGENVGNFAADILVEEKLIIENKAVQALCHIHESQLVHYLIATGIEEGLLLNFGSGKLEYRKKFKTYRKKNILSHSVSFCHSVEKS